MNDETKPWGMRILQDANQGSSSHYSNGSDPRVYWTVNTILITVSVAFLVFCFCGEVQRLSRYIYPGSSSDQTYRERIRQQRLQQEQDKKETPEQRRTKLIQSFHRHNTHSVVQDGDFVEESMAENVENAGVGEAHDDSLNAMEMGTQVVNETTVHNLETSTAEEEHEDPLNTIGACAKACMAQTPVNKTAEDERHQAMNDVETCEHDANESMVEKPKYAAVRNLENEMAQEAGPVELYVETDEPGYIKLRTVGGKRTVPNCCAICLCAYEAGESIVWSSTKECPHVFHEECVVRWLIKMQAGTPCPCCRRDFTDLSLYNESKKLAYTPQSSFDVSVISL